MKPGGDHRPEADSFPSGHTAGAVPVARALARDYPEHAVMAYAVAGAAAVVQIPRCKHYPTDFAAGAVRPRRREATPPKNAEIAPTLSAGRADAGCR